jgi:hypothetical protein
MRKTFVMRGQTDSGQTEILNFGKYKTGYAYRLIGLDLFPSQAVGQNGVEMMATLTAAKTAETATDPNFNNDGLIGTAYNSIQNSQYAGHIQSVINDTFLITQNLILMVQDNSSLPINWQCRFESVKMTGSEEAATNYKQFAIYD